MDDGRIWTIAALGAVLGGLAARGSRGVVRRPTIVQAPRFVRERLVIADMYGDGERMIEVKSGDSLERLNAAAAEGRLLWTALDESQALWILGEPGGCDTAREARTDHALWASNDNDDYTWEDVEAETVLGPIIEKEGSEHG